MTAPVAMKRVRIYVGERDRAEGRHEPLWEAILRLLREEHASGATAFRGVAGFGEHNRIHLSRLADVLPDLPVVIEWLDDAARVSRVLPRIAKLAPHRTITVEEVELYRHLESDDLPPSDPTGGDAPT